MFYLKHDGKVLSESDNLEGMLSNSLQGWLANLHPHFVIENEDEEVEATLTQIGDLTVDDESETAKVLVVFAKKGKTSLMLVVEHEQTIDVMPVHAQQFF